MLGKIACFFKGHEFRTAENYSVNVTPRCIFSVAYSVCSRCGKEERQINVEGDFVDFAKWIANVKVGDGKTDVFKAAILDQKKDNEAVAKTIAEVVSNWGGSDAQLTMAADTTNAPAQKETNNESNRRNKSRRNRTNRLVQPNS